MFTVYALRYQRGLQNKYAWYFHTQYLTSIEWASHFKPKTELAIFLDMDKHTSVCNLVKASENCFQLFTQGVQ